MCVCVCVCVSMCMCVWVCVWVGGCVPRCSREGHRASAKDCVGYTYLISWYLLLSRSVRFPFTSTILTVFEWNT